VTALRTRRPTGQASWPRILVTGEPGTDPAEMAAGFSGDERILTTYWLELNPGSSGDVYAAVPGADYELLDHDGTWADIYDQIDAAWAVAREAAEAGMPSALVVNSMSAVWSMLSDLADLRARHRTAEELIGRGLDPAPAYSSEVKVVVDPDLWTLVGRRHSQMMGKILTWPGPVILTAREKRDRDGRWVLKAQDQLGFDVTAWVRLTRAERPEIVSLLIPKRGRLNSTQRRALRTKFNLSTLVWDWCGCTADTPPPPVRVLNADQSMPGEMPPVRAVPNRRPVTPLPIVVAPVATADPQGDVPMSTPAAVSRLFDEWLTLEARDKVGELFERTTAAGETALAANVTTWLTAQEHGVLGTVPGAGLTLKDLATHAGRHVTKTGTAVRQVTSAGAA
jgi:hypothetical protein